MDNGNAISNDQGRDLERPISTQEQGRGLPEQLVDQWTISETALSVHTSVHWRDSLQVDIAQAVTWEGGRRKGSSCINRVGCVVLLFGH
jgi:hypothetical protein